jgi:protein-disulfide isomerase
LETHEEAIQDQENVTSAPMPTTARSGLLVTVVVGLVMLVIGVLAGYFGRPLVTPQTLELTSVASIDAGEPSGASDVNPSQGDPSLASVMDAVVAQTRHFKGDPNAPITIVEFSDFQCPYCGRFDADAGQKIDEQYVEAGLVLFGYQHFAFLGPESQKAAEASECAAEQDAFWPYHDLLFGRLMGENQGSLSPAGLSQYAAEVGLDTEAFEDCLNSGKYASLVNSQTSGAQSLGVTGTPAFLVNGRPLVGAQPFEVFEQVIEAELGRVDE